MEVATNLPPISPDRSIMAQQQRALVREKGKKGSRPSIKRNSVQFKKKFHGPPLKNVHIKTLDNKFVCFTPTSPNYDRTRTSLYPELQEPLIRKSNAQWSYKSHEGHPNLTTMPTRYSGNKDRSPASGIVPMPPKWIEMTEQLKRDDRKPKRKRSRKLEDHHPSVTFRDSLPPQPSPQQQPPPQPQEMQIRTLSITEARRSVPNEPPLPPKTSYPKAQHLPSLTHAGDQILIKERRASRKSRNKLSLADRAELFIMHTPSTQYRSHWIGPM